jgi:D-alanyl-lipoteichoic acid acyltransferase DltB (MBOAT superfamily)
MLFNSSAFLLVFLPLALASLATVDRYPRAREPGLLILSLAFYGYWDIRFLPFLGASIVGNWWVARTFGETKSRVLIVIAIAGNLAVLGLFKYLNFFAGTLTSLGIPAGPFDIVLPLGISFFTFHHIMYLVDLGRGKAPQVPLLRYALYICFFPQVLSGPLVRWNEIMHQFGAAMLRPGWERRCALGVVFIVIGLAEKVLLGDALGRVASPVFAAADRGFVLSTGSWAGVLAFTFQIFFDFAGYTDVAIGVALIIGLQLPRNFDAPYRATSIQDFWRRWHMTLSRFLRDYLYIPFGGNRHGLPRQVLALLATMALGGLWHGAGWLFVIWGLMHGIALSVHLLWRRFMPPLPAALGWLITFAFVAFTWIFFRAGSLSGVERIIAGLAVPGRIDRIIFIAAFCAIVLPPSHLLAARLVTRPSRLMAGALAAASIIVFLELNRVGNYEFIYFRF